LNHWISTTDVYDEIFDLDALVRNTEHPTRLQETFDSGDHIHPGLAAYSAVADLISLSTLRGMRFGPERRDARGRFTLTAT